MPDHNESVRPEWLFMVASRAQEAVCRILDGDRAARLCRRLWRRLPPQTRVEELIMQGLLFEVAFGGFGSDPDRRRARTDRALEVLTEAHPSALQREREAVRRTARLIRRDFNRPLNVADLARSAGCHPATLRRIFRYWMGVSMRQFQIHARMREALRLFDGGVEDILAVARLVGYRSEKNFYTAVRNVFGTTPARLRDGRLSAPETFTLRAEIDLLALDAAVRRHKRRSELGYGSVRTEHSA